MIEFVWDAVVVEKPTFNSLIAQKSEGLFNYNVTRIVDKKAFFLFSIGDFISFSLKPIGISPYMFDGNVYSKDFISYVGVVHEIDRNTLFLKFFSGRASLYAYEFHKQRGFVRSTVLKEHPFEMGDVLRITIKLNRIFT